MALKFQGFFLLCLSMERTYFEMRGINMDLNRLIEKGKEMFGLEEVSKLENAEPVILEKETICTGCRAVIVDEYCPYCRTHNPNFQQKNTQRLEDREKRLKKIEEDLEKEIQDINTTLYLIYFGTGLGALTFFSFAIAEDVTNDFVIIIYYIVAALFILLAFQGRKKPRGKKLKAQEQLEKIREERRNLFL